MGTTVFERKGALHTTSFIAHPFNSVFEHLFAHLRHPVMEGMFEFRIDFPDIYPPQEDTYPLRPCGKSARCVMGWDRMMNPSFAVVSNRIWCFGANCRTFGMFKTIARRSPSAQSEKHDFTIPHL